MRYELDRTSFCVPAVLLEATGGFGIKKSLHIYPKNQQVDE